MILILNSKRKRKYEHNHNIKRPCFGKKDFLKYLSCTWFSVQEVRLGCINFQLEREGFCGLAIFSKTREPSSTKSKCTGFYYPHWKQKRKKNLPSVYFQFIDRKPTKVHLQVDTDRETRGRCTTYIYSSGCI